jgi:hypothetical protein
LATPAKDIELAAGIENLFRFGYLNTLAVLTKGDWTKSGYYLEMNWETWNTILWRNKELADYEERKFKFEQSEKR